MVTAILNTILIVSAISGFLAFLLVIAEIFFANYGDCKIDINGKKELTVKGGNSLLTSLSKNKIFLASACGGRGSCGSCKCKVIEGGGPFLPTEKPFLEQNEIANLVRLACQIKVKNYIKIEIPENIFNIRKFQTEVIDIIDLTYDIKEFTFKLVEPEEVVFKAGQYVQFEAPRYPKSKQPVSRAYSISCSPRYKDKIQLIIRKVQEGLCTTYIFDYLKKGNTVNLTGPFGDFYIRDTENDIFFVAGGSGKAPIKSMVENLFEIGSKRKMVYFFGARTKKDLYYTELFEDYEKKLPDFSYIPVLSQPTSECDWKGRTGFIPEYFSEFIRNPEKTEAYLCGSPGMIAAVVKGLTKIGVPEEQIFFDKF